MMFHAVYAAISSIAGKVRDYHYDRMRRFDLAVLWPSCCEGADGNVDIAKAAFAVHAYSDPAWQALGEKGIFDAIDKLEFPPQPSITCPKCGKVSFNLNDVKNRYCGNCHLFHNSL